MSENQASSVLPASLFDDGEVYSVAEIAERIKCSPDTVERKMKKHKVKSFRFGAKKFMGGDVNRVLEAEYKAG